MARKEKDQTMPVNGDRQLRAVFIRVDKATEQQLENEVARLKAKEPAMRVTFSDAVRVVLARGLAVK